MFHRVCGFSKYLFYASRISQTTQSTGKQHSTGGRNAYASEKKDQNKVRDIRLNERTREWANWNEFRSGFKFSGKNQLYQCQIRSNCRNPNDIWIHNIASNEFNWNFQHGRNSCSQNISESLCKTLFSIEWNLQSKRNRSLQLLFGDNQLSSAGFDRFLRRFD